MTDLAFSIGGVSFSDIVEKGEYETRLVPVVGKKYTDISFVDHITIARYRGELTVSINPQNEDRVKAFWNAIKNQPVTVTYYSFQKGENVTSTMTFDESYAKDAFTLGSKRYAELKKITFTEV